MMDLEPIKAKRDQLQRQRVQAVANVHALDGALQVLEELLREAAESEKPAALALVSPTEQTA